MGNALSELILVIIGTFLSMFMFKWTTEDYNNFKKKAIIKAELNNALSYLREGIPTEKIPIEKGTEFLRASADSLFGGREFEIANIYKAIEKFNSEINEKSRDILRAERLSLGNIVDGISERKWMKALPFIGSRYEYIKYTIFLNFFNLKSWTIAFKNRSYLKFKKFFKSRLR